jgi:hypothetical protein
MYTRMLPWINIKIYGGISLEGIIFDGHCRWKLSCGNLYTFVRLINPKQKQKCNFRFLAGFKPMVLRFQCS